MDAMHCVHTFADRKISPMRADLFLLLIYLPLQALKMRGLCADAILLVSKQTTL
jgi:hypothetical protein